MEPQSPVVASYRWMSICKGDRDEPYMHSSNGVMAVPLNDAGEVLFIVEPDYTGTPVLFLPAGGIEPGESPAVAINRELQEEIGLRAGRLDGLHAFKSLVKYSSVIIYAFLARDFSPSKLEADETYTIGLERVPLDSFETLITANRLHDSSVIAALYLARQLIAAEGD